MPSPHPMTHPAPEGGGLETGSSSRQSSRTASSVLEQEPKYLFGDGRVINRASGEPIPMEEPVMVFRGRDRHAVRLIGCYLAMVSDIDHQDAVEARLRQFEDFASAYPDRMKEPDTAKPIEREDSRDVLSPSPREQPEGSPDALRRLSEENARLRGALEQVADRLHSIMRTAEMSSEIMLDRRRTGNWAGARKTAVAFDHIGLRAAEAKADARAALTAQTEGERS